MVVKHAKKIKVVAAQRTNNRFDVIPIWMIGWRSERMLKSSKTCPINQAAKATV
jgi:hypothetical protein